MVVLIVGMQLMSALLQPTAKIHLCSSADAPGRRQRTLVSMDGSLNCPRIPNYTDGPMADDKSRTKMDPLISMVFGV